MFSLQQRVNKEGKFMEYTVMIAASLIALLLALAMTSSNLANLLIAIAI